MTVVVSDSAALVVVDVQNGFVTEHSAHVVPVIVDLVGRWQAAGRDVVFTRYINHQGSIFERAMGWSKLQRSPEIDIVPELQPFVPGAVAVIDKRIYTMFTDEGEQLAKDRGWTEIYLCGIDTEVCVLKTAVDAFE
ncbi:MAG: cysteine hydrolase, partial [Actinomycetia bacterium]|nr:cysteine hydrolase [Actinomycetes bacterium]